MNSAIAIQRLPGSEGLPLPAYQSDGAAGLDLCAAIAEEELLVLGPGERRLVATGFAIALPRNLEAQIRPRSGLALKHGVTVLNAPGTIDSDYRGEIGVVLINHGTDAFTIRRGDRIAQMIVAPVARARFVAADTLDETDRGAGGFGSSGLTSE